MRKAGTQAHLFFLQLDDDFVGFHDGFAVRRHNVVFEVGLEQSVVFSLQAAHLQRPHVDGYNLATMQGVPEVRRVGCARQYTKKRHGKGRPYRFMGKNIDAERALK